MRQKALIWITTDQRLQDNDLFNWSVQNKNDIVVLAFEKPHLSRFQKKFLYQSLLDLKQSLELNHVDLYLSKGSALTELPHWIKSNRITSVAFSSSFNSHDIELTQQLRARLPDVEFFDFAQSTLLSINDLPFNIDSMPNVFTNFRKAVETNLQIKKPLTYNINELSGFLAKVPKSVELVDLESIDENVKCLLNIAAEKQPPGIV